MRSVEFKKSFDRAYRKLTPKDRVVASLAIENFLSGLEQQKMPHGLGLKRLRGDLWEIRADIRLRIAFRMKRELIEFGLIGTHTDLQRCLKEY